MKLKFFRKVIFQTAQIAPYPPITYNSFNQLNYDNPDITDIHISYLGHSIGIIKLGNHDTIFEYAYIYVFISNDYIKSITQYPITSLTITYAYITHFPLKYILQSPTIKSLSLAYNSIGEKGAKMIMKNYSITLLNVRGNGLEELEGICYQRVGYNRHNEWIKSTNIRILLGQAN